MKITGKTLLRFVLADPVAQVLATHNANVRYEADGLDVVMVPLHVKAEDLAAVVQSIRLMRNVIGFGITIPHKIAIMPLLDGITDRAARIGAVNTVACRADGTLIGDNLDGDGYIGGLAVDGIALAGRRVVMLGAGGAARAVAFSVAAAGAAEIVICNRSAARAVQLAAEVAAAVPACRVRAGAADVDAEVRAADLVVNTTSQGMQETDAPLFDYSVLRPEQTVSDIIMVPEMTPLLTAARARGCTVTQGRRMNEAMYALSCAFLGLKAASA